MCSREALRSDLSAAVTVKTRSDQLEETALGQVVRQRGALALGVAGHAPDGAGPPAAPAASASASGGSVRRIP